MLETMWTVAPYLGLAYLPLALAFAGYAGWSLWRMDRLQKMNSALLVRLDGMRSSAE